MFGATGTLRNTRFQCENRLALAPTPYEAAGAMALERHFGGHAGGSERALRLVTPQ